MPENQAMDIRIEPLAPSRAGDYLAFFDHRCGPAFADNRQWSTCYCLDHHRPKAIDWEARTGDDNRVAMEQRIGTDEMEGFLAYAPAAADEAGQVVVWVNVQPLQRFLDAGFGVVRDDPRLMVVQKTLSPP